MDKRIINIADEIQNLFFIEREEIRKAMIANGDRAAWERLTIRRLMVLSDREVDDRQSVPLTALRRIMAVSILFNLVLLIVFAVIIGGR